MRLLNLLTSGLLFASGVTGTFQDTREKEWITEKAQLTSHVKKLEADSARHAIPTIIHDTVKTEVIHDSIIFQKKTITIPLTGAESLRIGRIEYPFIQKEVMDSFRRTYKPAIGVKTGVKNDK